MGRIGKYAEWMTPDALTLLEGWARDGLSDKQIAHNIGITTVTLYDWKNKYPSFANALKNGKEIVDIQVENALLKRALGCTITETTVEESDTGKVKTKTITKQIAPDVVAQIFWLKNRRPDKWRDKREEAKDDENCAKIIMAEDGGIEVDDGT